jgi:flagellar biosynthesis anti-sigma factor FlgM
MKIENTGLQPLSTKQTQNTDAIERKGEPNETTSVRAKQDKVEMSKNARLLAKAHAALSNTENTESERVALLKQKIESGNYTIKFGDLAQKLMEKLFPK